MSPASKGLLRSVEFVISPQIKFKKKWLDNKGVSEIIGTILMLAITVVLFSSIMVFVTNMPEPIARPTADFLSSVTYTTTPTVSGTVVLSHNGGEALNDYETQILVIHNNVVLLTPRTMAEGGLGSTWGIGQKWTYTISGLVATDTLEIMVIDLHSNSQIWDGKISSGTGNNAPVILQRWADGNPDTLTVDPVVPTDRNPAFTLNVRVTDIDGLSDNLGTIANGMLYTGSSTTEGVWLDVPWASSIVPPPVTSPMARTSSSSGIWTFDFPSFSNASLYDGKPAFIHAKHHGGTTDTIQSFIFSIDQPDVNNEIDNSLTNITYNGTEPTSESGLPSYLKWFDADQGYVVLGANVNSGSPPRSPNLTDSRSTFIQDEYVFVRVGSFKLQNIFAKNNLTLINRLSGTSTNPTGNSTPFYRVPSGGVFIYETKFSTASLLGGYDMKIGLQSTVTSGSSLIAFNAVANLVVQPSSGPPLVLPEVRLNETTPLNRSASQRGTFELPFDLSDASKSIIWVDMKFLDAGAGQTLNIGKVEIKDLRDRTILSGVPPLTAASNSTFGKVYSNLTRDYVFKIDLRLRNGYNLVPGTATYTLTISNAFDGNEGVYTMSVPIWIRSATNLKNYIVATSGFGGTGNFNDISYLFQIENNKFFTTRALEKVAMAPGFGYDTIQTYRAIYFDIDGDSDRDVVASMNTPAGYGWGVYINRMNEYGIWEPKSFYLDPDGSKIVALAYGDINSDGAQDFATANSLGKVYLYYNTFPVTSRVLLTTPEIAGKYVQEMRLVDMTGDGKADLVTLVSAAERTSATKGQMFIYNLASGSAVRLPVANVNTDANVFDFDVADINKDGYNDYAASSSLNGVGWYQAVPTSPTFLADQDIAVPPTVVVNTFSNTNSVGGGDEEIRESGGSATHIWRTASISGSSPTLRIDTKVNVGCTEAFYFYYSTSSLGPWTFMFYVPSSASGSYQTFNQNLRSDISGRIYIKVADSVSGDIGDTNSIFVDLIRVTTISGMSFNTVYNSLRVDADSKTYSAIGIGDFNQAGVLDVAVGKDAKIMIIDGATGTILRTDATADIRVAGDNFVVKDVNGDNLADIVYVLKYLETIPSPNYDSYSIVTEWINTLAGTTGSTIEVKHLAQNYGPSASGKDQNYGQRTYGAINCILVENPYG
jgi:flagellin-like protein